MIFTNKVKTQGKWLQYNPSATYLLLRLIEMIYITLQILLYCELVVIVSYDKGGCLPPSNYPNVAFDIRDLDNVDEKNI